LERTLPEAPSFAQPVAVKAAQAGESCYVAYDRQKAGREQANKNISRYNKWYAGVRASYAPSATK
jgi:hypothetical protein